MQNLLKVKKHSSTPNTAVSNNVAATQRGLVGTSSTSVESGSFSKIAVPRIPTNMPPKRRSIKILLIILGVLVFFSLINLIFGFLPLITAYSEGQEFAHTGRDLATALKNQNLEEAKALLPQTREKLEKTKNAWQRAYLFKILPIINQYHQDGQHGLQAVGYALEALEITLATVEPYADLLGLKAGSSFVTGSADERIQVAVKTLDKVTPKFAEIGQRIEKLKFEIDEIDPQRYPESFRGVPLRSRLTEGKNVLTGATTLFLNARPLMEVLPDLLGEPQAKRYLVLFQNDAELRPTGGFLTAYAIFKVEQGKFIVEKSDDIYELDDQIKQKKAAPPEILTYRNGVYYFYIRDSNLSPDFSASMKQFEELYPNKFDFDGVIAVDTHVLVEAIKILGTFTVKGRTFSPEIDKRCDCPRVIYELEDYSTRPVAYVREERKDVLGELLLQIMKKALGVSPSQYWGQLFQMGLTEINQKHILAYMKDEKAQIGIESLNMGGRIANGVSLLGYKDGQEWDFLHINDANIDSNKSNLFVEHYVKQDYSIENDGSIIKTITIDYKNPAPPSDCGLESGGLCLNAHLYRNWLRIYVPKGSTLLENKGSVSPKDEQSATQFIVKEDLGKTVFEGYLTLRPLGTTQVSLKYKLPFKIKGNKLNMLVQKQPGTDGHENLILVNGKQKIKFNLTTDKVVEVKV